LAVVGLAAVVFAVVDLAVVAFVVVLAVGFSAVVLSDDSFPMQIGTPFPLIFSLIFPLPIFAFTYYIPFYFKKQAFGLCKKRKF
jgi:hypothetical protein